MATHTVVLILNPGFYHTKLRGAAALNCRTAWLTSNSLKTVRKAGYHPGRPGFGQGKKGLLPSLTVTIFSSVLHSRND